ncbi:uncharacterized protein RSE6_12558 [Rhynchosporium secalis]|uniref:Uncharacterized protein n=1 Tax=Rhynchosporium secalis TaxID=38038 RepID=A0A1E1MRL3_RHYSE|nr:uncharacterized protein RSE6_12558 [Rhynchosporium secalis]
MAPVPLDSSISYIPTAVAGAHLSAIVLPESLIGDKGAFRAGEHPGRFHFVRWLYDTPLYRDFLEIVAEKARHFWWSQQINLGLISWSTYLALEGQRRNISNLWAFLALAQMVNLSYAQNLFFVAVLLTPVPLPENVRDLTRGSVPVTLSRYSHLLDRMIPKKQVGFVPKPAIYMTLLVTSFATVFLIPYSANTTAFLHVSSLTKILPFFLLILPYVIPVGWGNVSTNRHDSHSTYITLFRIISTFSTALHLKSTALALFNNLPESTYYRHSLLHPFKEEHLTVIGRGSVAFGRIFGAMGEHPAVGFVASDLILTGLSLGYWGAIRDLDATDMLRSSIPFMSRTKTGPSKGLLGSIAGTIQTEAKALIAEYVQSITQPRQAFRAPNSAAYQGPGRPKRSEANKDTTMQVKERGSVARQRHDPISGDEQIRTQSEKKRDEDDDYAPSVDERLEEGDEDAEEDFEIAAFVWGLLSVAGLGTGSSAVYGA